MPEATSPRLRARHDVGRPPYAWRRLLVVVGSLGVTTGLTVTGAGLLRQGPLAWLGWSEQTLAPQQVTAAGPTASAVDLTVVVTWAGSVFCPQDLRVEAAESDRQVVIRRVTSRVPRLAMLGTHCAERPADQGRAYASFRLSRPLQGRPVVAGNGQRLEVRTG